MDPTPLVPPVDEPRQKRKKGQKGGKAWHPVKIDTFTNEQVSLLGAMLHTMPDVWGSLWMSLYLRPAMLIQEFDFRTERNELNETPPTPPV